MPKEVRGAAMGQEDVESQDCHPRPCNREGYAPLQGSMPRQQCGLARAVAITATLASSAALAVGAVAAAWPRGDRWQGRSASVREPERELVVMEAEVVEPAQCAQLNEECTASGCCAQEGVTCFEKHPRWAVCLQTCDPGLHPDEPLAARTSWSCSVRTTTEASTSVAASTTAAISISTAVSMAAGASGGGRADDASLPRPLVVDQGAYSDPLRPSTASVAETSGPPCPNGGPSECCDVDGSCADGDDDWCCQGEFFCSNDGADYAALMGGVLCPQAETGDRGQPMWPAGLSDGHSKHRRKHLAKHHADGDSSTEESTTSAVVSTTPATSEKAETTHASTTPAAPSSSSEMVEAEALGSSSTSSPAASSTSAVEQVEPETSNESAATAVQAADSAIAQETSTCSRSFDNCRDSRCCLDPQAKCFEKDEGYAACLPSCEPGVHEDESEDFQTPWSCRLLSRDGDIIDVAPKQDPSEAPATCGALRKRCTDSRCCADAGATCFEKDAGYAECRLDCETGIHEDEDEYFQTPWSCVVLSTDQSAAVAIHTENVSEEVSSEQLYCFSLVISGSYEVDLMEKVVALGTGICQCDGHAVYSGEALDFGVDVRSGKEVVASVVDGSLEVVKGGMYDTALNSEVFVRIWKRVLEDGQFLSYGWTIKVDADTVFIAQRLRQHLFGQTGKDSMYFNNCKDGLHGPMEIISRRGMQAFGESLDMCVKELDFEWDTFGEDVFLRHCLGLAGVTRVDDFELLDERFGGDVPSCNTQAVAFHPLKTEELYEACLAEVQRPESSTVLMH